LNTEKDWIFVSDAHFTGREPGPIEAFLRFLDSEKTQMSHLVILGDLFEFLCGVKGSFSRENPFPFADQRPVLEKLQQLYREGIRIQYFEGNHDFFMGTFFLEQFNMEVKVYPGGNEESLGGKRAFVAHGDLSNPKEWKYRALRRLLKNSLTYRVMQLAGPDLTRRVAIRLSGLSYQKFHGDGSGPPPAFRAFAHQMFLRGFEMVILGHSHFPEEVTEQVDGRKCLYFNIGDWMNHRSYLRFTPPGLFQLSRYGG